VLWRELTADPKHGPLPALLLVLTVLTGVVDSVSILSLGRVFVANMTGNVVFIGFAIARAPGFSLSASVVALAGFLLGAFVSGQAIPKYGSNRGTLLRNALFAELGLVLIALIVSATAHTPFNGYTRAGIAGLTAVALGIQNAVARRLAVPDLTTTVLTMTLTGIAADARPGGTSDVVRRVLAVTTMLVGAICGALLVLHVSASAALGLASGLLIATAAAATLLTRHPAAWSA
jgi:uncharacterized membrane protein YoaK (UPF0700 family)